MGGLAYGGGFVACNYITKMSKTKRLSIARCSEIFWKKGDEVLIAIGYTFCVILPILVVAGILGYLCFFKENEAGRTLAEARVWDAYVRKYIKGDKTRSAQQCRSDFIANWLPFL